MLNKGTFYTDISFLFYHVWDIFFRDVFWSEPLYGVSTVLSCPVVTQDLDQDSNGPEVWRETQSKRDGYFPPSSSYQEIPKRVKSHQDHKTPRDPLVLYNTSETS